MTVSSLLLVLREEQAAQEAVLTWQFFSLPPFPELLLGLVGTAAGDSLGLDGTAAGDGLGLHGTAAGVGLGGTAAGVGLGGTAAGVGLGIVGGESRGLPVVAGWLWLIPGVARHRVESGSVEDWPKGGGEVDKLALLQYREVSSLHLSSP